MHYVYKCKHGTIVSQCRCPTDKTVIEIRCPAHCPERTEPYVGKHRAE